MYFSSPVEKIVITNKRQQHKNPGLKVTSQRDVNRERKQKKLIRYSKWFERKFSEQFPPNVFLVSYAWTSPDLLECRFCNLFYTLSIKRLRLKLVMITIGHLKNILSTSDDSCLRFIHFNTHKYKSWVSSSFFSISKRIAVISPTSDFANVTFANVFGRFANAMSRLANVLLVTSPTPNI